MKNPVLKPVPINLYAMKKFLLILLFISLACIGFAQDDEPGQKGGGGARLEAYKIAYITKRLNLTPEEAQKFWPIYNKYTTDMRALRIENRDLPIIDQDEKIVGLRKKYQGEFSRALPPDRVNQFFKADREFNGFVQKEMMERRQLRMEQQRKLNKN